MNPLMGEVSGSVFPTTLCCCGRIPALNVVSSSLAQLPNLLTEALQSSGYAPSAGTYPGPGLQSGT